MQSVIKLMPDPIPEVPRDDAAQTSSGSGASGYDSQKSDASEFGRVLDQHSNNQNGDKPQQPAAAEGGNTSQSKRQGDGESHDTATVVANEKPQGETKIFADKGQRETKPMVLVGDEGKDAKVGKDAKADSSLDQLMGLVENSDKLIRQKPGNLVIGEDQLKNNKLANAIDSALVGKADEKRSVAEVLRGFTESMAKTEKTAQTEKGENSGQGKTAKAGKLELGQVGEIDPKLAAKLKQQLQGSETQVKDSGQTPDITPPQWEQTDEGGLTEAQLVAVKAKGQDKASGGENPPAQAKKASTGSQKPMDMVNVNGSLKADAKAEFMAAHVNGQKADKDGTLSPGPDGPTQEQLDLKQALEQQASSKMASQASSDKDKLTQSEAQKPNGLAGQKVTVENMAQADASAEQAKSITMAPDKATKVTNAPVAKADKRGGNILGKATPAKAGADSQASMSSDKSGQVNVTAEQKFKDPQLTQEEGQTEGEGSFDDLQPASTPKEAVNANQTKGPGQFATSLNQFSTDSATRLNATTATLNSSGTEKTPPQLTETLNINRPDLSVNMKERLTIMMNKGIQTADIRLDPAELGQMQVKMSVENDVTSVSFVVQNSQAKELLEQMMPKLREMLAEQGVEMGEGSVSEQQQQELGDDQEQQDGQLASNNAEGEEEIDAATVQELKITNGALGGIDFFA